MTLHSFVVLAVAVPSLALAQVPSLDKAKATVKSEAAAAETTTSESKVESTTETTKKVETTGGKIRTTAKTEGKKVVKKGTAKAVEKVPVAGQAAPALESAGNTGVDKGVDLAADKAKLDK